MKRTRKSIGYEESKARLDFLFAQQKFRDLWRFEYASRHVRKIAHKSGTEEYCNQIFEILSGLLETHETVSENEIEATHQLLKFSYGLIYALHRTSCSDGFIDLRVENQLPHFKKVLKSLNPMGLRLVEDVYQLTCRYGFLFLDLWQGATDMEGLALEFIKSYPDHPKCLLPIPKFTFIQKEMSPTGIQIEVPPYEASIRNTWDLAVYFNNKEAMSAIKTSLTDVWSREGQQSVGNDKECQIALYVDRKLCTKNHAASALELQVDRLKLYNLNPEDGFVPNPEASYIDQIRLEEAMLSKSWDSNKDNVRRAVGLYLWDQINRPLSAAISRKVAIKDCIDLLEKSNPDALECYYRTYNTPKSSDNTQKLGDLEVHFRTVVREMEADYDLTEFCIEAADYHSPHDAKHKK